MFAKFFRSAKRVKVPIGSAGALLSAATLSVPEIKKDIPKIENVTPQTSTSSVKVTIPQNRNLLRRLMAFLIDTTIVGFTSAFFLGFLSGLNLSFPFINTFAACIAPWIPFLFYGFRNINGRSIGQYLMRLQVYTESNQEWNIEDGLARNWVFIAPFLFSFSLGSILTFNAMTWSTFLEYSFPGRLFSEYCNGMFPMGLIDFAYVVTMYPQNLTNFLTWMGFLGLFGYDLWAFWKTGRDLGDDYSETYVDLNKN